MIGVRARPEPAPRRHSRRERREGRGAPHHTRLVPARDEQRDTDRARRRAPHDRRDQPGDEPSRERTISGRRVGRVRTVLPFGDDRLGVRYRAGHCRRQQHGLRFGPVDHWKQSLDIGERSSHTGCAGARYPVGTCATNRESDWRT